MYDVQTEMHRAAREAWSNDLKETTATKTLTYEDCAGQRPPPVNFAMMAVIALVIIVVSMCGGALLAWMLPR
jgi:hypothetical protein